MMGPEAGAARTVLAWLIIGLIAAGDVSAQSVWPAWASRSAAPRGPAATAGAAPEYALGELIVKFKSAVPAGDTFGRGEPLAQFTGSSHLDEVQRTYHVQGIRALFPHTAAKRLPAAGAYATNLSAQFPVRARRAPPHARMPDLGGLFVVSVPDDTDILALAAEYASDPSVQYAEPSYVRHVHFVPNDYFFSSSGTWGQHFPDLWGLHNLHAEDAWDLSTGAGVTVAVIDTGLRIDHPDIAANVWTNPGEIPGNGIDDDGNGYVDDVHGYRFWANGSDMQDNLAHGTHVSGTIAAAGNNGGDLGSAMVGMAFDSKVMPLAVFDGLGATQTQTIAQALMYAVDNGADVVNMSYGGLGEAFLERDMIDFAAANGLVLVASAGNDATAEPQFPAGYDSVISVGAVDHLDVPASFSNYGGKLELTAPGGGDAPPPSNAHLPIFSVLSLSGGCAGPCIVFDLQLLVYGPTGGSIFLREAGTSMAAPHVSGVAALVLSRHPEFTAEQVRQVLRDSAEDLGQPGRDARYGYGRVDAAAAVRIDAEPVARLTAPQHLSQVHGEALDVSAAVHPGGVGTAQWRILAGPQGGAMSEIASGSGDLEAAPVASLDTAPWARGNYVVRLEAAAGAARTADTLVLTKMADRPYLRELTDDTLVVNLSPQAWSPDGRTLVWGEGAAPGFFRFVHADLSTMTIRPIVEYRFGGDRHTPAAAAAVLSADGRTVAFSAPEDLSISNRSTVGRNFQLFTFDMASNTLQQISHVAGGGQCAFCGLTISADGRRIAFLSGLDLDATRGNADGSTELFYWDKADGLFHQVTDTTPAAGSFSGAPSISAAGDRIVALSSAALDPLQTNPNGLLQAFVYDVSSATMRQLTNLSAVTFPHRRLEPAIALSPDGSRIATVLTEFVTFAGVTPGDRHILQLIDTATGTASEPASTPWEGVHTGTVTFSPDGQTVLVVLNRPADPSFKPFARTGFAGLYRFDIASATLRQLTGTSAGVAMSLDGRLALNLTNAASDFGIDPEGRNPAGLDKVYLLDPAPDGGFLWTTHGQVTQYRRGPDRFTVRGQLLRPSGTPIDADANDVSFTLLGANGQLVRTTLPAGSMRATSRGWIWSAPATSGLTRLVLTTSDHVHYAFQATGKRQDLFRDATPYLTAEVQVGPSIFSNAQRYRQRSRALVYP
jgi:subtilisin family serine protease/Tol biopolymer transport system component